MSQEERIDCEIINEYLKKKIIDFMVVKIVSFWLYRFYHDFWFVDIFIGLSLVCNWLTEEDIFNI